MYLSMILMLLFFLIKYLVLWSGSKSVSFRPDYGWRTILWRRLDKVEEEISLTSWGRLAALLLLFCLYCSLTSWQFWNCFGWRKVFYFAVALQALWIKELVQLTYGDLNLFMFFTWNWLQYIFWYWLFHLVMWWLLFLHDLSRSALCHYSCL